MGSSERRKLAELGEIAVDKFSQSDWIALGARADCLELVRDHHRLLRSLAFGDDDYEGHAYAVLSQISQQDETNLATIEAFVDARYGEMGESVSTAASKSRKIVFSPSVFDVPDGGVEADLVALMIPFSSEFEPVFASVERACAATGFRCRRAKDIWEYQAVIQDIFALIFRAQVVVCDVTGKNPNVFYEAGIAHTLGKTVIPLTQSAQDIPFDISHHRYLLYLNNDQGRTRMRTELQKRLAGLMQSSLYGR